MSCVRGLSVLVVCLAAGAGCGVDELVPTDAAVDAAPEIDAEEYVPPPPRPVDYVYAYQAIRILTALEERLPSLLVNGRFPEGAVGLTPPAACCAASGMLCPVTTTNWVGVPLWDALAFRVDDPHAYQFGASSAGGFALTINAVGDLDCDGSTATITMTCTLTSDLVSCQLALPEILD